MSSLPRTLGAPLSRRDAPNLALGTLDGMTPAPPDGILRHVTERTWAGTLHGYRVQVFHCGDSWCMAVINPQGHVETCPRVTSFAEGARRRRIGSEIDDS